MSKKAKSSKSKTSNMASYSRALGIDFGTSNSAAGFMQADAPLLIEMAPDQFAIPTTFFFDFETRETLMGTPANDALLKGAEGRFMRALKRVLGTSLMHEKRQILNERVTFVDIIARFLRRIKDQAEQETGCHFDRALSGRPVVFHGVNVPCEKQAEEDLRVCYLAAGFSDVAFLYEPEAAAIASGAREYAGQIGLIVDIGGGTSDFSLFRAQRDDIKILANHGVRIGGTDFDKSISIDLVMPMLGKGTNLRRPMGEGTSPVPVAMYNDLATWEKIPFLYSAQNLRRVQDMVQLADAPRKLERLAGVLQHQLGHDLAFAVEAGKISANTGEKRPLIVLDQVEAALAVELPPEALVHILASHGRALERGVETILAKAALGSDEVDHVIYVGGSSMMSIVTESMHAKFPKARHTSEDVFTAVAKGLAIAASRM